LLSDFSQTLKSTTVNQLEPNLRNANLDEHMWRISPYSFGIEQVRKLTLYQLGSILSFHVLVFVKLYRSDSVPKGRDRLNEFSSWLQT